MEKNLRLPPLWALVIAFAWKLFKAPMPNLSTNFLNLWANAMFLYDDAYGFIFF
jgi:predicted permease